MKILILKIKALEFIAETCNGDMRSALNKLELAFNVRNRYRF